MRLSTHPQHAVRCRPPDTRRTESLVVPEFPVATRPRSPSRSIPAKAASCDTQCVFASTPSESRTTPHRGSAIDRSGGALRGGLRSSARETLAAMIRTPGDGASRPPAPPVLHVDTALRPPQPLLAILFPHKGSGRLEGSGATRRTRPRANPRVSCPLPQPAIIPLPPRFRSSPGS